MNVRGMCSEKLFIGSLCGNWVFCLFIYCRPMSHTLLWHFRCLIFYSLTLTEPIQKVNAHIVPHVPAQGWVHRKLLSLLPGNSQGDLSRAWGFAPGCGDRTVPAWQAPVSKEATGTENAQLPAAAAQGMSCSPTSSLGDFACGSPLLIPRAVKLAENIDFLRLITEMEW